MNNTNTNQSHSTEAEAADVPAEVPPEITPPDPETERIRAENIDLRNSLRLRDARDQVRQLLEAADARSPELLFTSVKEDLQFGDDGKLQNAAALVERLKRNFPEQFGVSRAAASIDGGAGSTSQSQFLSPESLARMTPAQIQKLDWQDVRRVLGDR